MSRLLCIQFPNAFYHIFSRGSNKQVIFLDENDFRKFKQICLIAKYKFNLRIYAYCLMNNHYHLYLSTPNANIAESMKYINEVYAMYFLKKYQEKDGHVFRGRYGRKLVQNDRYSMQLIRYIHLNPVAANLVNSAWEWKWSSYLSFLEPRLKDDLVEYDWTLDQFGNKESQIETFRIFHENLPAQDDEIEFEKRNHSYLGDENFVAEICQNLGVLDLTETITSVIRHSSHQEFESSLVRLDKNVHDERLKNKLKVYLLREVSKKSLKEIATLTNKTVNAVSKINKKFLVELERSENLQKIVSELI